MVGGELDRSIIWRNGQSYLAIVGDSEVYHVDGSDYIRPIEIDGSVTLDIGPWGRAWKNQPGILTPNNPLMFTCSLCGETGSRDFIHAKGCNHPYSHVDDRW